MLFNVSKQMVIFGFLLAALGATAPAATARGSFFDYHGTSMFYGQSQWTNVGPEPAENYEWTSVNYLLGKDLTGWLALETWLGAGFLNSDHHGNTPTIEARIMADAHYGCLFLKLGWGAAHLFEDQNLPGLAPSTLHTIISGSAGFRFQFRRRGNPPVELRLGYGVEHMSAPTKGGEDGDEGWNAGGIRICLAWPF
ncbi:MAG: hypothetical protein HUN04_10875 [Desulfobacter sp.]|nr:MAG: hypothetical protein HUN04_10875 [Desulfobacter sp.]